MNVLNAIIAGRSGTTGTPKAVMVTHDSVTWMAQLVGHVLEGFGDNDEFIISYLPLSHIAAQIVDSKSLQHLNQLHLPNFLVILSNFLRFSVSFFRFYFLVHFCYHATLSPIYCVCNRALSLLAVF